MGRLLLSFLTFFLVLKAYTQEFEPVLKRYSVEQGLPGNEVYQAFQDSRHFIWLATGKGVSKFDGKTFVNFTSQREIPDNVVLYIAGEDKNKTIWFYCMGGDFFGIDINNKIINPLFNNELKKYYNNGANVVPIIFNDGFGFNLFTDGSLIYCNNDKVKFLKRAVQNQITIYKSCSRFSGMLTIDSSNKFHELKQINIVENNEQIKKIKLKIPGVYGSMYRYTIINNEIVGWYKEKLYKLNTKTKAFDSLVFNSTITDVYIDNKNLFVSTQRDGLFVFKNKNISSKPFQLLKKLTVGRIIKDNQNGYWIPTLNNGLYYWPSENLFEYNYIEDGLQINTERIISNNNEAVFSLSNGKYFLIKDNKTSEINYHPDKKLNSLNIYGLFNDTLYNRILVSSNEPSVIQLINGAPLRNEVNDVGAVLSYTYAGKKLYTGSWANVKEVDPKTLKTIFNGLEKIKIRAEIMHSLNSDSILIGSVNGLSLLIPSKQKLINLGEKYPLLANKVKSIVWFNKSLVLSLKNNGLVIINNLNWAGPHQIESSTGLISNNVNALKIYQNSLWICTDKGIQIFNSINDLKNGKTKAIIDKSCGLLNDEIRSIAFLNHDAYVITNENLIRFNVNKIKKPQFKSKLVINSIFSDSVQFGAFEVIIFNKHTKNISINYSGINYYGTKLKYSYLLCGLDEQWRLTDKQQVDYTNLGPGKYTFYVSISSNNGVDFYNTQKISFEIKPDYYQTAWFKLVSLLFIIIIGGLMIRYQIRNYKYKTIIKMRSQIRAHNSELKALRAQMNPHFIFNVITSIQHYIIENDNKKAYKYLSSFAKLMRGILNSSERKDNLLADELAWLTQYLELEKMRFNTKFEYKININKEIDPDDYYIPSMVLQPIIENAIKHGVGKINYPGLIEININQLGDELSIEINDNGPGILKNTQEMGINNTHRSMATKILKDRVAIYNEIEGYVKLSIDVVDRSMANSTETGTSVRVSIRLNNSLDR